jgi:hypothetical protein
MLPRSDPNLEVSDGAPQRVNYDHIAHLYDAQPYRARETDTEPLAFVVEREGGGLAVWTSAAAAETS